MQNVAYQELFPVNSPQILLKEVMKILNLISQNLEAVQTRRVFGLIESLYQGTYPGYRACTRNTMTSSNSVLKRHCARQVNTYVFTLHQI